MPLMHNAENIFECYQPDIDAASLTYTWTVKKVTTDSLTGEVTYEDKKLQSATYVDSYLVVQHGDFYGNEKYMITCSATTSDDVFSQTAQLEVTTTKEIENCIDL